MAEIIVRLNCGWCKHGLWSDNESDHVCTVHDGEVIEMFTDPCEDFERNPHFFNGPAKETHEITDAS
jgi:hypothetical protein